MTQTMQPVLRENKLNYEKKRVKKKSSNKMLRINLLNYEINSLNVKKNVNFEKVKRKCLLNSLNYEKKLLVKF